MRMLRSCFVLLCCAAQAAFAQPAAPVSQAPLLATPTRVLAWDSELKESSVSNGVLSTSFVFNATNVSAADAIITGTQTSCGCTVAKLPSQPWVLPPGSNGQIQVVINLAGKTGTVVKQVQVFLSNQPPQFVSIKVNIAPPPTMTEEERSKNREMAKVDAQAIFKGSCADCHVTPSRGRMGAMLYDTMCGVCHEAAPDRRASMVPNLHSLKKPTDYEFWRTVITNGKTNSLMPAFAAAHGGPLNDAQINSVAEYLARNISRNFQRPVPVSTPTNAAIVRTIPGLKPLPPLKKLDPVTPPTVPVVPPVTPPTPPPTNFQAQ